MDEMYWWSVNNNMMNPQAFIDIQFDQLDIESGTFSLIHKQFDMNKMPDIRLSKNEFNDKNDSFGLIHYEPDAVEWLFLESV